MPHSALLIEPGPGVHHTLRVLEGEGFKARTEAASTAIGQVMQQEPTLILLDEETPPLDGVEVLPLLRRITRAGIIVIGAGGEAEVVKALLEGADIYVSRPVNPLEFQGRMRALLRRLGYSANGGREGAALKAGQEWPQELQRRLTATEARLLSCLLDGQERVVGHDELMAQVWGGPVRKERLRYYICQLRRKVEKTVPMRLLTHKGIGYRLVPTVSSAVREQGPAPQATLLP